jgi:nitroimidazol reductase NimA-like FMN-containing flavoprotein (pyridoxamine 5'-phosphate oxidase superfamily)
MLGELNNGEVEQVLHRNVIGRIGCHAFGRTYVVPITYVYDGTAVYARSTEGMKLHMMRENPHVCFEVDAMDGMANWESVIASGTFHELHGADARERFSWLISELSTRLEGPPGETVHPMAGVDADASVVYKIVLEEKEGRFERRL